MQVVMGEVQFRGGLAHSFSLLLSVGLSQAGWLLA